MSGANWLEELEARLNQQLESFLRSNPEQEALLAGRSEEHTSELQSQFRISYAVFCL